MRYTPLFILLLFAVCSAFAQTQSLERSIDECIRPYTTSHNFYGTVYVAKAGRVLYEKSFGYANIELSVPNENNTVYHLASVSKPITATAILLLEQQGKLNTKDLLSKYIPHLSPTEIEFIDMGFGKPEVHPRQNPDRVCFNISHSDGYIFCYIKRN